MKQESGVVPLPQGGISPVILHHRPIYFRTMLAIHYTCVRNDKGSGRIFGLEVAVVNWLKAYFRYGTTEKFNFLIGDKNEWDEVLSVASESGIDPARLVGLDRRYVQENMAQFDTVFRPVADPQNLLWQREQLNPGFSFCGLTHAASGIEAGQVLEKFCLAPADDADAIICPSYAIKSAIDSFWDVYAQYLERRFGVKFKCPVQLPIIPLGIDMAHMEARVTPDKRAAQRAALGIADNEVMLLWVGRLSAAIKAHPLAMFQAAERAAQQSNAPLHFVLVGYFVPDEAEAQFQKLAQDFCSKVKIHFVKNNDAHFPDGLWAGADVFISLVDNMQESFGLTPIEAMAAGLPRIITDWDGYRDCVEHGVDGFLVPTLQPPPGSGDDLSRLLLNEREMYGGFLAKTALSVAVDVKAAADALVALINTPSLRKSIGDRARDRVRATYDWKHIIPQYESLWGELAARRKVRIPYPVVLPQAPDPFTVFESFASRILQKSGAVSVVASPDEIQKLWSHDVNMFAQDTMLSRETIVHILKHIAGQGTCSLGSVLEAFANVDAARIWRTMGWLIKLDILKHQK